LAILYRTPLDLKISRVKAFASGTPWMCDFSTKEVFHRKPAEDFLRKESRQFIARATQQVFRLHQPASQWWQLELPVPRDSSFQSPQAAGSWELDLSQELQFQFFARTPREARHWPECRCISS
jgi:hypothetical protein